MEKSSNTVANLVARVLAARGVTRVFALCGGHIMPIWMSLDRQGIRIIDVRDERAGVHMAHAHAELTGELGVALVTAGPGMTNAITGIANAHVSRAPVLVISGTAPRPQENRGGLQDLDQAQLVRTITRYARTVREPSLALQELDEAIARAFGESGEAVRPTSTSPSIRCGGRCRPLCSSMSTSARSPAWCSNQTPHRSRLPLI